MSGSSSKPKLDAPASTNTVRVRLVDTTGYMNLHAQAFIDPVPPGHETMNMTDVAFLIENEHLGKKALFDLGIAKDFWNLPPVIQSRYDSLLLGMRVDKDVRDILEEKNISPESINDIIWSHSHWDHVGDPTRFPPTTNLVYGSDLSKLKPGYPTNPDSAIPDSTFQGRRNIEIDFRSTPLQVGGFPAHDFYGDGSFYLLETPGHSEGHLCGLARTTPDTFIFLGGDVCHFPGDFRPNTHYPLPDPIPSGILDTHPALSLPCPAAFFLDAHPQSTASSHTHTATTPFYRLPGGNGQMTAYETPSTAVAQATVDNLRDRFDGAANVLVAIAHDPALLECLPTLNKQPERDLNAWAAEGWKDKCLWGWLNEVPKGGKPGRDKLVEGYYLDGKRYDTAKELIAVAKAREEKGKS